MNKKMLQQFLSTEFTVTTHAAVRYLQYLNNAENKIDWSTEEIETGKVKILKNLKYCRHYAKGKGGANIYKTHKLKYVVSKGKILTFIPKNRKKKAQTLFEIESEAM